MSSFIIRTLYKMLLWWSNQEAWDGRST